MMINVMPGDTKLPPKDANNKSEYEYFFEDIAFPIESIKNTRTFIAPQIQMSRDGHYARFNNAIYRFAGIHYNSPQGWKLSYELPNISDDVKWSLWAINQNGNLLIQDTMNNDWMVNFKNTWYRLESIPEVLKKYITKKIILNDKGHIAAIFPKGILTAKIMLPTPGGQSDLD